jgi:hypothetical protein
LNRKLLNRRWKVFFLLCPGILLLRAVQDFYHAATAPSGQTMWIVWGLLILAVIPIIHNLQAIILWVAHRFYRRNLMTSASQVLEEEPVLVG